MSLKHLNSGSAGNNCFSFPRHYAILYKNRRELFYGKANRPLPKPFQRSPYLAGLLCFLALTGIIQVLDYFFPLLEYAPDLVSSIMSTCSEVIAGLYGITLTGSGRT